jgi:hypothetical protein
MKDSYNNQKLRGMLHFTVPSTSGTPGRFQEFKMQRFIKQDHLKGKVT